MVTSSVIALARLRLLARWALRETVDVARDRVSDIVILLIAIAVAWIARGASRHQTESALGDAAWFVVVLAIYLAIVLLVRLLISARNLSRRFLAHTSGQPQHPCLNLDIVIRTYVDSARCVVTFADGTVETVDSPNRYDGAGIGPFLNYPSNFPVARDRPDGPPRGTHHVEWFMRERPDDQWVSVATDRFTYDPIAPSG